jgi:prolyl oligopeptidase
VGSVGVVSSNRETDVAFLSISSFIEPDTVFLLDASTLSLQRAKSAPARFNAKGLKVEQHEATSADGERIPYFVIGPASMKHDGKNPTLLYGYGGFQISLTPSYSGLRGKLWLERGGVHVIANIRGGGEFGPTWHQAALKTKRQTAFNDFIAVAEDLIRRKITSPRHLGVMGGSNGGLLVGAMFTQRPELWNAVVCQVPLLDMLSYHTLLAGASWVGEYGDPELAEERVFLETISPYHNIRPEAEYPEIFFVTSTKDDRVHPAHARKMAARLEELGRPFLYYENIEGGHSAAANLVEAAKRTALEYVYLVRKLMD